MVDSATDAAAWTSDAPRQVTRAGSKRLDHIVGLVIFLLGFNGAILFSSGILDFYRDDNVICVAPFIVEAARQIEAGRIPLQTWRVGGGGGTALLATMQPGVLSPFNMGPALLLRHDPEMMINVIVSLHVGILAAGMWFLGNVLGAPRWASLVASIAMPLSGFYWIWAGRWMALLMPYAFLPWFVGGVVGIALADKVRRLIHFELVAAVGMYLLFASGIPNAAAYAAILLIFVLLAVTPVSASAIRRFLVRMIPQVLFFAIVIAPLLWVAYNTFNAYGEFFDPADWVHFSVPPGGYLGLLNPISMAWWDVAWWRSPELLSNVVVSVGLVPCWYIVVVAILRPGLIWYRPVIFLLIGLAAFALLLSPGPLGLANLYSALPVLSFFRYPFRGLPAFHALLLALFLVLARASGMPRRPFWRPLLVMACVFGSIGPIVPELLWTPLKLPLRSWYYLTTDYRDKECWSEPTVEKLRRHGYALSLCRVIPLYQMKRRLFMIGNLGAQYRVPTVGNYPFENYSPPYRELGLTVHGVGRRWEPVKRFLDESPVSPPDKRPEWKNGIGPESLAELTEKTCVRAALVERGWREPMEYFLRSDNWTLVEERSFAAAFIRTGP